MSLDFSLYTPAGEPCETCGRGDEARELYDANVTHNVTPMWDKAGVYDALYRSHGKRAGDVVATLRIGLADMVGRSLEYRALNPPNGWGSYEGALHFLRATIAACEANPEAIIGVNA